MVHVKSEDIAKDLTQDVFFQLVRREGQLSEIEDIEAYVFTIARNAAYRYFKKIQHSELLKAELVKTMNDQYLNVEENILVSDLELKLYEIVNRLPDRQREVFHLSREKGLSHKEIADELQISTNTVKNHLVQALKTLRANYKWISSCVIAPLLLQYFISL